MARQSIPERTYTGFHMIPVSGVGEVVGGVSESVGEEKIGSKRG